jgi:DNA replication protein DnaC
MTGEKNKQIETVACSECFKPFQNEVYVIAGRTLRFDSLCDECAEKAQRDYEKEMARAEQESRLLAFQSLCPPLYQDTDPALIYAPYVQAVESWEYGPQGLILVGPAGKGKSRAAWMLIKRWMLEGKRCYGTTATQLAKAAADQWHSRVEERNKAEFVIQECRGAGILLIDDLGKQKFTERAELELFDILEYRTSHKKPTIATSNADGKTFRQMLSEDRGEPILRRLHQFSTTIHYK